MHYKILMYYKVLVNKDLIEKERKSEPGQSEAQRNHFSIRI